MKIFGYGSLMNENSLKKTVPDAHIIGTDTLKGYRRHFDFKSPYRKNEDTGIFSSVLNISTDSSCSITGVLIELSEEKHEELLNREQGYESLGIELISGEMAYTFIACDYDPYKYIFNDEVQSEYLNLCISAATKYGFLNNFLESTFIGKQSIHSLGLV
jgi:gamma-glutamylcyclotransferase (GGCT)/AIG2-like uncharacterized protein YtfP